MRATTNNRQVTGLVLGAAVLTTGLLAGVFYAFSVAVMPGLERADDRTLIDAIQQINKAIENPVFFLSFLGAPLLIAAAAVLARRDREPRVMRWTVAALGFCLVAIVVTGALNIPLNDDLAKAGDPQRIADPAGVQDDFLGPWVAWNIVRTLASTAALGALAYALVLHGRAVAADEPQPATGTAASPNSSSSKRLIEPGATPTTRLNARAKAASER